MQGKRSSWLQRTSYGIFRGRTKSRKREGLRCFREEQVKENEELRGKKGQLNANAFLVSTLVWLLGPGKLETGETGNQGYSLGRLRV